MAAVNEDDAVNEGELFDPRMRVLSMEPANAETSLADTWQDVTPDGLFYLRNHFPIPRIDAASWSLQVGGLVERPLVLGLDDVMRLPARTVTITLECAGNGRTGLHPPVAGEQWDLGAVSTARWTGVPLQRVLEAAGVLQGTRELLFPVAAVH